METDVEEVAVMHRFVMGMPESLEAEPALIEEQILHNDLLLLRCPDGYDSMSQKVLAGISWAYLQGQQHPLNRFYFLVKTDQDIYLRLDVIISELLALRRSAPARAETYWSGFVHRGMKPISNVKNKNADLSYPLPSFPPYPVGALYTMSFNLAEIVARVFATGRIKFTMNEDQMLGQLLQNWGLVPSHDRRIQQWKVCQKDLIAIHYAGGEDMQTLHRGVLVHGDPCHGFPERTLTCPLCYHECLDNTHYDWTTEWECSEQGASLKEASSPIVIQQPSARTVRVATSIFHSYTNITTLTPDLGGARESSTCSNPQNPFPDGDQQHRFILIWTTAPSTFTLKQHRVLESILFHHPKAHVRVFSNTLPCGFFESLNAIPGSDVRISRYDSASYIPQDLTGLAWLTRIEEWRAKPHFYAHEADFLRMLLLDRFGGIYMDFDVILLQPVRRYSNIVIAEYCDAEGLDYCIFLPELGSSLSMKDRHSRFYIPIGMLFFQPGHPIIKEALRQFDTSYNPDIWPCGTVFLTKAVQQVCRKPALCSNLWILPPKAVYPVEWQSKDLLFENIEETPAAKRLWETIRVDSMAIHLWNKMTAELDPVPGTIIHSVFESYSLFPLKVEDIPEDEYTLTTHFNGGFEEGLDGWWSTSRSVFFDECKNNVRSGKFSIRIVNRHQTGEEVKLQHTLPLLQQQARRVLISAWTKSRESVNTTVGKGSTSNGIYAMQVEVVTFDRVRQVRRVNVPPSANDSWTQISIAVSVRHHIETLSISLIFSRPGVAWFDDVSVREHPSVLSQQTKIVQTTRIPPTLAALTAVIEDGEKARSLFGPNLVANPHLMEKRFNSTWKVKNEGATIRPSSKEKNPTDSGITILSNDGPLLSHALVYQTITCNQSMASIFLVTGQTLSRLSSSSDVPADYSIYADLILADGTPIWGSFQPMDGILKGTWQNASFIIDARPHTVAEIALHLILRNFKGEACFRDISLQQALVDRTPLLECS